MSAFDMTLRVNDVAALAVPDADGRLSEAQLLLSTLAITPVGVDEHGREQMLPIPLGTIRAPISKATVKKLLDELQAVYDDLEDRTAIQTASNMSEAERIAKITQGLT